MMKEFKEKFCVIIFSGDREVQRFHEMTKETNGLGGKKSREQKRLGEEGCAVSDITYRVPLKR